MQDVTSFSVVRRRMTPILSELGKDGDVRNPYVLRWFFLVSSLVVLVEMSACAVVGGLPLGEDSWKEEVLLHDGSKLVITRSQTYGGSHEIGQPPPIKEHTVAFTLPHTNKTITWSSEYGKEVGRTNFHLLAVHVLNGTPYIVAEPNLCLSYNKWGRPNPPYVFFKYDGTAWQRIPLEEFPVEFKSINVVIGLSRQFVDAMVKQGVVPVEQIQLAINALLPTYEGRGFALKAVNGGWRFYSSPEFSEAVEKFVLDGQQNRLTQAALETLAVIAYRQPISRARVSAIRGVNVEAVMKTLVTRGLVDEYGVENETGAILYRTTSYFLERLGLNSLTDLPPLAPHLPDIDGLDEILESLAE